MDGFEAQANRSNYNQEGFEYKTLLLPPPAQKRNRGSKGIEEVTFGKNATYPNGQTEMYRS